MPAQGREATLERVDEVLEALLVGASAFGGRAVGGEGIAFGIVRGLIGAVRAALNRYTPEELEAVLQDLATHPPRKPNVDLDALTAAAHEVIERRKREAGDGGE